MKFELDHRTGMMRPKKDEEIYFAQSQGGGLIVDDKKNNIKYIIERDGRITKLFGSFDKNNLNLYDMRDSRIIADRVRRLLGIDHKYTDFHYFLRGYRMSEGVIKTCSDFLEESIWSDIQDRSMGNVRKEDGRIIGQLEDGTKLIMPNEAWADDGELVDFGGSNIYTFNESGEEAYIAVINEGDTDVYYRYDEDSEEVANMIKCFEADESLRTNNNFGMLRALMNQDEWDNDDFDDLEVSIEGNYVKFEFSGFEFIIYDDIDKAKDDAVEDAINIEKEKLEGLKNELSQKYLSSTESENIRKRFHSFIDNIRDNCGNDGFDEDELKDVFEESFELDYDEFDEEDAIDALLSREIIEDTEEYFDLDEDGEIDHTLPKFDYQDYKDKYVEKSMEDLGDFVDEYVLRFGYDGIEEYIDFDKVGEIYVDIDGPAHWLAYYDGVEIEETVDGQTYYIYRR